MKNNGVSIDASVWRKILSEKLGYSFKRCSPRPLNLSIRLKDLKKTMFWVKFLKMIQRSTLLINIDETWVSYLTKSNYSWWPKSISANLSTIKMNVSISIVSAIWSNGISITGLRNGTITSKSLVEYINYMLTVCSRLLAWKEKRLVFSWIILQFIDLKWSKLI